MGVMVENGISLELQMMSDRQAVENAITGENLPRDELPKQDSEAVNIGI